MNNNIIKMFIGSEEVVSNKEFTINEEMLSASSTILNNCYPASWEESKDYVSNFYYPKDYSKFILGKGNFTYGTDQYSILSVSGETFMQFTTNVEKELAGFTVYGKTNQETTILPNTYTQVDYLQCNGGQCIDTGVIPNSNTRIDIDFAYIKNNNNIWNPVYGVRPENNSATYYAMFINDTSFKVTPNYAGFDPGDNSQVKVVSGGIYNVKNNAGNFYFNDIYQSSISTNNSLTASTKSIYLFTIQKVDGTIDNRGQIIRIYRCKFYNDKEKIRDFIPCKRNSDNVLGMYDLVNDVFYTNTGTGDFTYGNIIDLPTPIYKREIQSVGYQNLFNEEYEQGSGLEIINTRIRSKQVFHIEKGKTYVLKIEGPNADKMQLIFNTSLSKDSYPFTTPIEVCGNSPSWTPYGPISFTATKTGYMGLIFSYISGGIIRPSDMQNIKAILTDDGKEHAYIPYGKYGIEIQNNNSNFDGIFRQGNAIGIVNNRVFNKNNFYLESGNYTIYTNLDFTKYKYAILLSNLAYPNPFGSYYDSGWKTQNEFTFNVPNNSYIGIIIATSNASQPITPNDVNNYYFLLEKSNNTANDKTFKGNRISYILNAPLRQLENVKDRLYLENGKVYVERNIGSKILNGTENWIVNNVNNYRYPLGVDINDAIIDPNYDNADRTKCDYFIANLSSETTIDMQYINTYRKTSYNQRFWFMLTKQFISSTTVSGIAQEFKDWLSNHNMEIIYQLQNPVIEELTDVEIPSAYEDINYTTVLSGLETTTDINYYWKNYDVLFAGIVKNSGDISLRPTNPKYCSLQILDYKTFLSESDTLDFVISDKTIAEAITMVVDAISGYGFILGTINISQADDIIGAYSTLNKTAYDVFQYLANISGSRWRARFVDNDTMAIDFYDPELLPRANDIDYTQQYWEDNKIVDLTFNYGTRDYRNKQIILSDEVYGGIDYTEVLLSNGYGTSYITQNNIANITSITVNGVEAEVITQSEKDLGVDADFYYTPGKNIVESTISYTAGTQIIITYTPLVKGRQIVYNDEEVTRIATQTNTTGIISRYENRNDILSSDELENIAETYIKYKGKPEIILKLITLNNDLFNIGEICYFNSPIADLAQDYMVKSKATNYTTVAGETNIFYTYELTSSFNSEKAINYFDNQRNKATGNIAEGESITRNIDINNSAMIIWENATITEISVSVDGDNALNSVLNSPFIQ